MVYPAGRCSWRPLGGGQECCQTSEIAWNRPPTPRELSGPRFQKSAEAEKACLMPVLCTLQPRPSFPLPGSAGEASWSCLEPCVRSSARGSAAPAPTPLPPHPPQDETRQGGTLEKAAVVSGGRAPSVCGWSARGNLVAKPFHEAASESSFPHSVYLAGTRPPDLVRAAAQEGPPPEHTETPARKPSPVNVCLVHTRDTRPQPKERWGFISFWVLTT